MNIYDLDQAHPDDLPYCGWFAEERRGDVAEAWWMNDEEGRDEDEAIQDSCGGADADPRRRGVRHHAHADL